jgi:hypothetical protein
MHDIRGEKGQNAEEQKPTMPVQDWANVLEEPADDLPRATIGFGGDSAMGVRRLQVERRGRGPGMPGGWVDNRMI